MTPRLKDTEGEKRGLSAFGQIEQIPGQPTKVQVIDIDKLDEPLAVSYAGGHVSIIPVRDDGTTDEELLRAWAASRDDDEVHDLTQKVLNAVVGQRMLR